MSFLYFFLFIWCLVGVMISSRIRCIDNPLLDTRLKRIAVTFLFGPVCWLFMPLVWDALKHHHEIQQDRLRDLRSTQRFLERLEDRRSQKSKKHNWKSEGF